MSSTKFARRTEIRSKKQNESEVGEESVGGAR
jgi:hypothetical protein